MFFIKAAQEARNQMGNKKYYNIMILDSLQSVSNKRISDKEEITSIRDYMQVRKMIMLCNHDIIQTYKCKYII